MDFVTLHKRVDNAPYTAKLNGRDTIVQAEEIARYKKGLCKSALFLGLTN